MTDMTHLQILIPAFGPEGIAKVVATRRPAIPGVEYLVSWQQPDTDLPVPVELRRPDFRVKVIKSRGVARNRNSLLSMITAPLALWSDDNDYNSPEHIATVLKAFEENPDADLISFRADHPMIDKYDPPFRWDWPHIAKGYYLSTSELAMRPERVLGKGVFNENFGVGAFFPIGEEEIYARDLAGNGCRWRYLPVEIVHTPGDSTSERIDNTEGMVRTKGAVMLHFHPMTWPGRMLAHALRYRNHPGSRGMIWYLRCWITGACQAARKRVFRKKNYVVEDGE